MATPCHCRKVVLHIAVKFVHVCTLVHMYGAINALKTVLIKPFKPEFFCADFKQWVEQAVEYQINCDRAGCSAAVLYFDKTDVSDAAFKSLKALFQSPDVEVYHPPLTSKVASQAHEWFSQLFDFKLENDYTHRMVTLENLPESVTETVIKEKFPEAFNIIFYGQEGPNKGIGTMELPSEEKVQSLVGDKLEIEIDGEQVLLHRLNTRINKWHKELKYGAIKMVKTPAAELEREAKQIKEMSDEDRIEKCKRYQEVMKLKDTAKDRADISSAEIIKVHEEYSQEMKILSLSMMNDTDRRFKDTGTFPEPEDIMLPYTTQVHTAKLTRGDKEQKRQEKKKQYSKDERRRGDDKKGWSPGAKGHKRSNSSSYNKGGPPHKKSNSSYDSGYHGGDRKGGYNKGGKGGRDYDDRSRRGYQGGRDRHRDRDRGSGSFGNVTSKMENAIMSLAEKMSHLEKLQLGTSGMGSMGAYGGQGGSGYMGGMQDSGYGSMGGRNEGGYGGGYNSGGYNSGGGSRGSGYNRSQKYYGGGGGGGNRY